jgi:hypothetical protein
VVGGEDGGIRPGQSGRGRQKWSCSALNPKPLPYRQNRVATEYETAGFPDRVEWIPSISEDVLPSFPQFPVIQSSYSQMVWIEYNRQIESHFITMQEVWSVGLFIRLFC